MKEGFQGERSLVLPQMVVGMMEEDRLLSALHITDIGYYPAASLHEIHRPEGTGQYVFIYCVNGCGWYEVDGRHYDISANQYFIIPSGHAHAYGSDRQQPWTIYWIHFKGTLASCYADKAAEPRTIRPELHSRIADRQNLFEEIYNTLEKGYALENLSYASSLFHYYLGSLRYIHQYREAAARSDIDEGNVVESLIHYMEENREHRLSLDMLSRYSGYSVSHLTLLFRRKTGYAPLNYFNMIKMKEACWMLDNTSMRVNQICHKVGFDDSYYFSRLFSKIVGMSPKAYRERVRG